MKKFTIFIFFVLSLFVYPHNGWAKELSGQSFPDRMEFKGKVFELRGVGVEKRFLIKIFVAGFYTAGRFSTDETLNDKPKRIEVAYLYPIPGKKLAAETRKNIILNTTKEEFKAIESRVDVMDALFVDLRPGDRYALTFLPQEGTYFTYNGKVLGFIEGHDFAKALFAVWIGQKPISPLLKSNLLSLNN